MPSSFEPMLPSRRQLLRWASFGIVGLALPLFFFYLSQEYRHKQLISGQGSGQLTTKCDGRAAGIVSSDVDWSRYAYVQYVTELPYLCNTLMLLATLDKLGCRGDRLLLYTNAWTEDLKRKQPQTEAGRLLSLAASKYHAKLQPISVIARYNGDRKSIRVRSFEQLPGTSVSPVTYWFWL